MTYLHQLHWSEQLRVAPAIELTHEQEGELTSNNTGDPKPFI